MNRKESRHANTFNEQLAHPMTRRLRSNHRNIDKSRRHDLAEMNVEPVGKHQSLSGAQVWLDRSLVNALLLLIGNENHDDVRILHGLLDRGYGQSIFFRANRRRASRISRDLDVNTAVTHVQ